MAKTYILYKAHRFLVFILILQSMQRNIVFHGQIV
jgi:hypothetical protein